MSATHGNMPLLKEGPLADTLQLYMPSSFSGDSPTNDLVVVLRKLLDLDAEQQEAVANLVIGAYLEGQDAAREGKPLDRTKALGDDEV